MFSDAVQLADINDFITPEQECIIQTGSNVKLDNNSLIDDAIGFVKIKKKNDNSFGHFNQIITDKSTNTARITLDDCLACSGCITSAETVLIKQQSTLEMESYLNNHTNSILIVTISNQALIAIAKRYKMSATQTMHKVNAFFKNEYGAKYVLNTSVALEIVQKESIHEFITNYTRNFIIDNHQNDNTKSAMDIDEKHTETLNADIKLPILTSECPGFVCYAEKSCRESVLQYISALKSPQQIMGVLIKKYLCDIIEKHCSDIYHVTVMPCYDKKLEASRKEFMIDGNTNNREVDCVITSIEIEQLLISKGIQDLSMYESTQVTQHMESECDDILKWIESDDNNHNIQYISDVIVDDKGCHGYLENIFIMSAKQLFGIDLKIADLKYKKLRNEDIEELTLSLNEEQIHNLPFKLKNESMLRSGKVLHFLRCYGFRNIQNVIRKIERNQSKYHYIEIMACPFGCLNGGGQIRAPLTLVDSKKISKQREHIQSMRTLLNESLIVDKINRNCNTSSHTSIQKIADIVYQQITKCNIGENKLFKMTLNHVGDNKAKVNINW